MNLYRPGASLYHNVEIGNVFCFETVALAPGASARATERQYQPPDPQGVVRSDAF